MPKADALRDLSKDLTVDKIAALKSKYLMIKRNQIIKDTEDDAGGSGSSPCLDQMPLRLDGLDSRVSRRRIVLIRTIIGVV